MSGSGIAGILALNVLFACAGAGILAALRGFAGWAALGSQLGIAHMLGFAAVTLTATQVLVAGRSLGVAAVVAISLLLLAAGIGVARLRSLPLPGRPSLRPPAGLPRGIDVLGIVPAILVTLVVLAGVRASMGAGVSHWDAWAFWVPKGIGIFEFGGIDEELLRTTGAPSYPLVVPALHAMAFRFMGSADTVTLSLQHALLWAGFVFAAAGLLRPRVPRILVWPFLGLPFLGEDFRYFALAPLADLPLAYLFTLGFVATALWLTERTWSPLVLAGVFFAAAVGTKREGLIFVVAAVAAAAAATVREARWRWPPLVAVLAVAWLANLPWRLWWQSRGFNDQGTPTSAGELIETFDRVGAAVRIVATLLSDGDRWLLVLPLGIAAVLLAAWRGSRALAAFTAITVALGGAGLVWVLWLVTSLPLDTSDQTPAPRAVAALALAVAAATPLLLHSARPFPADAALLRRGRLPGAGSAAAVAAAACAYVAVAVVPDALSTAPRATCITDPLPAGISAELARAPSGARATATLLELEGRGYQGLRVANRGCDAFAVILPGIPSREIAEQFRREAENSGITVRIVEG